MSEATFFKYFHENISPAIFPAEYISILEGFCHSFIDVCRAQGIPFASSAKTLHQFVDMLTWIGKTKPAFEIYHQRLREPFDFYTNCNDILRELVDFKHSTTLGVELLPNIHEQLARQENVIFLANHQSEADPQAMSLLLDEKYDHIGEKTIFVAGNRVTSDPFAIMGSLGRNLICVYSKKYLNHPPEDKHRKAAHNVAAFKELSKLLDIGGNSVYVAPSGGRDRPNVDGTIRPALFDPDSIEFFALLAKKAKRPTHFYPLALSTANFLPPPKEVKVALGEDRICLFAPIGLAIGPEIDMENFPGCDADDKITKRLNRSNYIYKLVCNEYDKLLI